MRDVLLAPSLIAAPSFKLGGGASVLNSHAKELFHRHVE